MFVLYPAILLMLPIPDISGSSAKIFAGNIKVFIEWRRMKRRLDFPVQFGMLLSILKEHPSKAVETNLCVYLSFIIVFYQCLNVVVLVGTFNQEKALVGSRGLFQDCKSSSRRLVSSSTSKSQEVKQPKGCDVGNYQGAGDNSPFVTNFSTFGFKKINY